MSKANTTRCKHCVKHLEAELRQVKKMVRWIRDVLIYLGGVVSGMLLLVGFFKELFFDPRFWDAVLKALSS